MAISWFYILKEICFLSVNIFSVVYEISFTSAEGVISGFCYHWLSADHDVALCPSSSFLVPGFTELFGLVGL